MECTRVFSRYAHTTVGGSNNNGRLQPFFFLLFNATQQYTSVERKKEDDSLFCGIWTLDKEDDPLTDETVWPKANPNLGVTARKEYLRQQIAKAKGNAVATTNVLTKLFNVWVSSSEEWIAADRIISSQAQWQYEVFADNYAYMGVDLGATSDLTAVSVMIPTADKYFSEIIISSHHLSSKKTQTENFIYSGQSKAI